MTQHWTFTLSLQVEDPQQLLAAALAHPDCASDIDLRNDDDSINIEACLVILLDPSTLPGCEIMGSDAEEIDIHDIDLGDER